MRRHIRGGGGAGCGGFGSARVLQNEATVYTVKRLIRIRIRVYVYTVTALAKREEARRTLSTSSRELAAARAISRTTLRQVTTSNDGVRLLRKSVSRCCDGISFVAFRLSRYLPTYRVMPSIYICMYQCTIYRVFSNCVTVYHVGNDVHVEPQLVRFIDVRCTRNARRFEIVVQALI